MNGIVSTPATCFGKVPTRGDFVKGNGQHQLIGTLDRWVSLSMEQLSEDPRWKSAYDNAPSLDFAFVGSRSRISVVGHLKPSQDSSGRRFPFITATTVERDDSLMFRCAPAGLPHSFGTLARIAEAGVTGAEVGQIFADLEQLNCAADFELALQADPLGNFVRRTSVEALAEILAPPQSSDRIRRIILALGLLMRPALGQGSVSINKEISFPLPADERYRNLVAGLWLYLVSAFLRKTSVELQLVISRQPEANRLVLGFNGASPRTLLSVLLPETTAEYTISLDNPEWIDDHPDLTNDYGLAKLSAYLAQPTMTLESAINTFREVFLGE
ncbi:type VI secretion system-associated protein TagF [Quatrionicoccus australiensis]|uniref:type VI secretion system-associated protein TagF n=1 Tax=Quatrionicoccus australiensis TaxID=138118 RepID=UPI001CF9EDD5|nr:type VI secretion system-associated protein TagF [Quatrionicoccus australiensis]MCB4359520.1 type VI secretion system-associated protein TagF [Quatrionicoccus australiensis]